MAGHDDLPLRVESLRARRLVLLRESPRRALPLRQPQRVAVVRVRQVSVRSSSAATRSTAGQLSDS
jgi:hypothetical protein